MAKKSAQPFSYSRIISVVLLVLFLIVSIALISQSFLQRAEKTSSQAAEDYLDGMVNYQLKNRSWIHQQLFRPQDIPLPDSVKKAKEGLVDSLYSPSVIKKQDGYYMFFTASIRCLAGGKAPIYRDSIGLAWSPDGIQWAFLRYVLEPDQSTCFAVQSQWTNRALMKVSDPYVFQDGEIVRVLYTATRYSPENTLGCSSIGIAAYDTSFKQIFRNDNFLVDQSKCSSNQSGIARPSLQRRPANSQLWFDSDYAVYSMPFTAVDQMTISTAMVKQATTGVDIDTPYLDNGAPLVLSTGGVFGLNSIVARTLNGDRWSTPWAIVGLSGQEYDSWYQRTPSLMVEDNGLCTPVLYYAGVKKTATGAQEASIARAVPKDITNRFNFIQCDTQGTPPPVVNPPSIIDILITPTPTKKPPQPSIISSTSTPRPTFYPPTPTKQTPSPPPPRLTPTPFAM